MALSTIITILISLTVGDGRFYPVMPELIADCGGELNAVMLQTALSMLYGAAWAGGGAHLAAGRLEPDEADRAAPARLFRRHLPHRLGLPLDAPRRGGGVALYFGIFFAIYALVWLGQYLGIRRRLREVNRALGARRERI